MAPDEYKRLLEEVERSISSERKQLEEKLSVRREYLIEAVKTTWKLANKTEPPDLDAISDNEEKPARRKFKLDLAPRKGGSGEAHSEMNRNEKLRAVIRDFSKDSTITTEKILEKLEVSNPEIVPQLQDRKTIIAKVLRNMADKGEVKKIRDAVGNQFSVYVRI